jgi:hypothetical protein
MGGSKNISRVWRAIAHVAVAPIDVDRPYLQAGRAVEATPHYSRLPLAGKTSVWFGAGHFLRVGVSASGIFAIRRASFSVSICAV